MARLFAIDRDETFKRISTRLNLMRKREELVDFTIFNNLGDEVKGHMVVMAVSCPVIKDMANSFNDERRLLLRDVSAEAMEQLINFMYIGEIEIATNTVDSILSGAMQLRLTPIETVCVDFMRANLMDENNGIVPLLKLRRFG